MHSERSTSSTKIPTWPNEVIRGSMPFRSRAQGGKSWWDILYCRTQVGLDGGTTLKGSSKYSIVRNRAERRTPAYPIASVGRALALLLLLRERSTIRVADASAPRDADTLRFARAGSPDARLFRGSGAPGARDRVSVLRRIDSSAARRTIRTRRALLRELHKVRERGFAINDGESEVGLIAPSCGAMPPAH